MHCRRTAKLQVRCARGGGRGCGESGALARGWSRIATGGALCALDLAGAGSRLEPHRYGGALCALDGAGAGSRRCRIASDVRCAP